MNAEKIVKLVQERKQVLEQLLEITHRQVAAIEHGRMNELMSLLAEKQQPLESLRDLSRALAAEGTEDPEARIWDNPQQRSQCQQQHASAEEMLQTLLRMEAECEQALSTSRASLQQQLQQNQTARQAVSGYAQADQVATSGGTLDLSSF